MKFKKTTPEQLNEGVFDNIKSKLKIDKDKFLSPNERSAAKRDLTRAKKIERAVDNDAKKAGFGNKDNFKNLGTILDHAVRKANNMPDNQLEGTDKVKFFDSLGFWKNENIKNDKVVTEFNINVKAVENTKVYTDNKNKKLSEIPLSELQQIWELRDTRDLKDVTTNKMDRLVNMVTQCKYGQILVSYTNRDINHKYIKDAANNFYDIVEIEQKMQVPIQSYSNSKVLNELNANEVRLVKLINTNGDIDLDIIEAEN